MDIKVENNINFTPLIKICKNDDLWFFAAKEWQRLIFDKIPKRDGNLSRLVTIKPRRIIYRSPYSAYIYYGRKMVDPVYKCGGFTKDGINWYSRKGVKKIVTKKYLKLSNGFREWDKAAIAEKKDDLLIEGMQKYIIKKMGG